MLVERPTPPAPGRRHTDGPGWSIVGDLRLPPLLPSRLLLVEDNEADVALVRDLLATSAGECCLASVARVADARALLFSVGADCVLLGRFSAGVDCRLTMAAVLGAAHQVPVVILSALRDEATGVPVDGPTLWGAIGCATALKRADLLLRRKAIPRALAGALVPSEHPAR